MGEVRWGEVEGHRLVGPRELFASEECCGQQLWKAGTARAAAVALPPMGHGRCCQARRSSNQLLSCS